MFAEVSGRLTFSWISKLQPYYSAFIAFIIISKKYKNIKRKAFMATKSIHVFYKDSGTGLDGYTGN